MANTLRSPIPVTEATEEVGVGAGTTLIGRETLGMMRQNGVTKRRNIVLALSSATPLSLGA